MRLYLMRRLHVRYRERDGGQDVGHWARHALMTLVNAGYVETLLMLCKFPESPAAVRERW